VRAALLLATLLVWPAAAPAQPSQRDSLHAFLQTSFAGARIEWSDTTYVAAFADLNGDGRDEALVALHSGLFCGSGGCALYVYSPAGASWRQLAELTVANAPVRLLNTRSRGWRDLAVHVRDGGMGLPTEVRIRFDGRDYEPDRLPAPRLRRGTPGRMLIGDASEGRRLFE